MIFISFSTLSLLNCYATCLCIVGTRRVVKRANICGRRAALQYIRGHPSVSQCKRAATDILKDFLLTFLYDPCDTQGDSVGGSDGAFVLTPGKANAADASNFMSSEGTMKKKREENIPDPPTLGCVRVRVCVYMHTRTHYGGSCVKVHLLSHSSTIC